MRTDGILENSFNGECIMRFKVTGSVLLILGTSIGAGMLALPVVCAQQSWVSSTVMLIAAWLMMTLGAFSLLEVNLWFPAGSNLITMAHRTLGEVGRAIVWLLYLALLYCLICAYLSAAGDVITGMMRALKLPIQQWLGDGLALIILGLVVVMGMRSVDLVNRVLMCAKLSFFVFVVCLPFKASPITFDQM